jgi:hypothetical protein
VTERISPPVVRGVYGAHENPSDAKALTVVDLDHVASTAAPRGARGPARNDHRARAREAPQRGPVQVIPVCVGDQNRIKRPEILDRRNGNPAPDVKDAAAQQRVGQ